MPKYQFTEISTMSKTYTVWAESEDQIEKQIDQWVLIDEQCIDSFLQNTHEVKNEPRDF